MVLACLCAAPAVGGPKFNLPEARKGVVYIRRITPGPGSATGSGFLVDKAGLTYTNRHVAVPRDKAVKGTVLVVGVPSAGDPDTLRYFRAEPVYLAPEDSGLDFGVLKIAAKKGAAPFPALPLSYEPVALGGDVAALGYPSVGEDEPALSFTKGSVSATRVRLGGVSYLQTDAAVNPGNSGGPLVNARGRWWGSSPPKRPRRTASAWRCTWAR